MNNSGASSSGRAGASSNGSKFKSKKKKKNADDFKTYLGNKQEGQGFADKRKKKAAYEYLKMLKKEKNQHIREGKEPIQHRLLAFASPQGKDGQRKKPHAFTAAERASRKKQEKKQKFMETAQKSRQEKDAALKAYKERKRDNHLKLCKKTSKGQPVMRHQMEVLLQKIKKQKDS